MSKLATLIAVICAIAGAIMLLVPLGGLSVQQSKSAGLAIILIGLFATARLPEYLTALLFFLIAMLFAVAPPAVVFSGFQSTALWLVFGGLVIGMALSSTGLGKRIAMTIARYLQGSYPKLIIGMSLVGLAFAFLMPSGMGRLVLLVPIALEIAHQFGFREGSKGRIGIVLATILGSFFPAFAILPANVPNMVFVGMAESQFAISPLYGEYLLLHFPVLGALKLILIVLVILWLYPDKPVPLGADTTPSASNFSRGERTLSVVLVLSLGFWITDFAHHISPAWIGLAAALYLLMPRLGVVSHADFNTRINFSSLFFVAGVIGLGVMILDSGLASLFGGRLVSMLPLHPDTPFINFMSVMFAASLTGLIATLAGVPAIVSPLIDEIASVTGLPIKTVLMMQVLGFSTMLLPYTSPPVVVALQIAGIRLGDVTKPTVILAVLSFCVLAPIDFLWWRLLGWL